MDQGKVKRCGEYRVQTELRALSEEVKRREGSLDLEAALMNIPAWAWPAR